MDAPPPSEGPPPEGSPPDDDWVLVSAPRPSLPRVPDIVLLYLTRFLPAADALSFRLTCARVAALDRTTWRTVVAAVREARRRARPVRVSEVARNTARALAAGALCVACVGGGAAAIVASGVNPGVVQGTLTVSWAVLSRLTGTLRESVGDVGAALRRQHFDCPGLVAEERGWTAERDFDVVADGELLEQCLLQRSDVCVAVERQRYNPAVAFWSRRMVGAADPPPWECPQLDVTTHDDAARVVSVCDLKVPEGDRHRGWAWGEGELWEPGDWRYGVSFAGAGPSFSFCAPHCTARQRVWRRRALRVLKD